ncbi:hypothetical protein MVEN_01143600 [Mycena venus]|uniref:Uncharacterized protein n=1 Tax=Mycena venus TaxID=2733690 RepID=A0A8H6Y0L1_9AGAR|nr:hypothetical protein MVEN_01143600 [Mycena venus]
MVRKYLTVRAALPLRAVTGVFKSSPIKKRLALDFHHLSPNIRLWRSGRELILANQRHTTCSWLSSPTAQMLAFEDLGEDVALFIHSLCDVDTVLLVGRVRRSLPFSSLTMRKQLWILLVEDLISSSLVDRPHTHSLADHSVELIALIKRTVLGPATWSPETSPILAEEMSLSDALLEAEHLQMLPGGRISNTSAMRAVEMLDGGHSVVLCLSQTCSVIIIKINLETGESEDLCNTQLPSKYRKEGGVMAFSSDLLAHAIYWDSENAEHGTIYAFLLVD